MTSRLKWFGVRCLFEHPARRSRGKHVYEERIVIVEALSEAVALRKAERNARSYAGADGDTKYLGFSESYAMYDKPSTPGAEVFSLMRSSKLGPGPFVTRYFDDGTEHRRK